jgi:hypothetical protein
MSSFWTSMPGFSGAKRFNFRLVQATLLALCALSLPACTPEPNVSGAIQYSSSPDIPAPPGSTDRPLLPGQSGKTTLPNGMPDIPPHGIKIEELLADNVSDPMDRVKRLENAVIELRHDFDAVMPSITRLVSVEADMQTLISQLDTLTGNPQDSAGSAPAPLPAPIPFVATDALSAATQPLPPQTEANAPVAPANAPAETLAPLPALPNATPPPLQAPQQTALAETEDIKPLPEIPKVAATAQPPPEPHESPPQQAPPVATATQQALPPAAAPAAPAANAVSGVRVGDHPDKTRLVLDLSGKASYRYDLDNDEHLLVIELTDTEWKTAPSQTFTGNGALKSYSTEMLENGKGTRLVLQLKGPTKVLMDKLMPADGTSGNRIVIDLKK